MNGIVASFDMKHVLRKLVLHMMSFLNVDIIPYHVCPADFSIKQTETETSRFYVFDPEIDQAVCQKMPKSSSMGEWLFI